MSRYNEVRRSTIHAPAGLPLELLSFFFTYRYIEQNISFVADLTNIILLR